LTDTATTFLPHHAPAPAALAAALESQARTLQTCCESIEQTAAHAEGLPVLEVALMLADLHQAADLLEGVADKLWRRATGRKG
jgi:hypothetical protein